VSSSVLEDHAEAQRERADDAAKRKRRHRG
jgi:hypothetical protein